MRIDKVLRIVYHSNIMKRSANTIINQIMSGANNTYMLLTKFDGEHVGFLHDLSNDYRETFWLDRSYDCEYPLLYSLVQKLTNDPEFIKKIDQFFFTRYDEMKGYVLLGEMLSEIGRKKTNSLLIIGNLDYHFNGETESTFLFLINHCPENLKIVFVSESFLPVDYTKISNRVPILIQGNELELLPDAEIDLSMLNASQKTIVYALANRRCVEGRFAREYFDEKDEILLGLVYKYRNAFFHAGNLYVISPRIRAVLERNAGIGELGVFDMDEASFAFFMQQSDYIKALSIGVKIGNIRYINESIKAYFESDNTFGKLLLFIRGIERFSLESETEYALFPYARLFLILYKYEKKTYRFVAENTQSLLGEIKDLRTKNFFAGCYYDALIKCGKISKAHTFLTDYFHDNFAMEQAQEWIPVLEYLLSADFLSESTVARIEKNLLDRSYINRLSYPCALEDFFIFEAQRENYRSARMYLQMLRNLLPFYIPVNRALSGFFFSDIKVAQFVSEKIIEIGAPGRFDTVVAEAYIVKGLVCMTFGQNVDALTAIDQAVSHADNNSDVFYRAVALKICVYAMTDRSETGRDMADIYALMTETNDDWAHMGMFLCVSAYCDYESLQKSAALEKANRALNILKNDSPYYFFAEAIRVSCEKDEKSAAFLLEKLDKYGYDIMYSVFHDLFRSVLQLCETNPEKKYLILRFAKFAKENENQSGEEKRLSVNFFGGIGVYDRGKELQWKTKKARELFFYYLLRGEKGASRQEIINLFWSDYVYVSAINNLKTTNNIIRNVLKNSDIDFSLDYMNEKYILRLKVDENDYDFYQKMQLKANREKNVNKKTRYVLHLIKKFGEGFCPEIKNAFFDAERNRIRLELARVMVQLIRALKNNNDTIEMNRFLVVYRKIVSPVEYSELMKELGRI